MTESYNIYCMSNASGNIFTNNSLTSFKNILPKNLDLEKNQWEIGIVKFGFHFNSINNLQPSIVSVSTDVVTDSLSSQNYSTLIYDTSLLEADRRNYYYHYVKHIKYYPIRNTFIDSININFLDINGQQISLQTGQPSIVHFHLRTMNPEKINKTHYVRIDSRIDALNDFDNKNNNFWVHLKNSIPLNQNSKLSLVDISFPNSIRNISSDAPPILLRFSRENRNEYISIQIPPGRYLTNESLVNEINNALPQSIRQLCNFSVVNRRFMIKIFDKRLNGISIPLYYQHILGITQFNDKVFINNPGTKIIILLQKDKPYLSSDEMNVMYNYPGVMLCHTNFVKHSIAGDSFYPILKIIPTQTSSTGQYISVHFENLEFIDTNAEYLKELHFEFKDIHGNFIDFNDDRKIILNFVVQI